MDDMDGLTSNWASPSQKYGGIGDVLENVVFSTYGRTSNPCGIYTQGGWILYQLASHHVNFEWLSYGVVQSTPELNAFQMSDAGDFEVWDHSWFFMDLYPWISYNGGGTVLSNIELSTMTGPQILQAGNVAFDTASGLRIEGVEFETVGFTPTGYGFRIDSSDNIISNASLAGPGTTAQINGHNNKCVGGCGGAALALGGSNNSIDLGGTDISTPVTDQGRGNTVVGVYSGAGAFAGMQTNYVRTLLPYKGESQISGRVTADNIADGNYSTPYNKDDLLIWPQDFIGAPSPGFNTPYSAFYIPDAASPTGAEWTLTNVNLPLQYGQFTNNSLHLTVGTTLPAARATVVYMAKCLSAVGNFSLNVKTSTNAVLLTDTHACSTTLTTYSATVDFSGSSGQSIGFNANTTTNILVAWIALRPYVNDVNGKTITGAGAAITTGPTTSTLHDCPWFTDTVGTIGDSGSACSAGGGLSGQTSGYLPKATSATGSTAPSTIDDGVTTASTITAHEPLNVMGAISATQTWGPSYAASFSNTGNSAYNFGISSLCPNLTAGEECQNVFGGTSATSANNTARWIFHYTGAGSTSNYFYIDFYGATVLTCYASGYCQTATQSASDNSTRIATTAFVKSNLPLAGTTASIGGASLAAGACTSGTVNVTGATTSMAVVATPVAYPGDGMDWRTYVSSSGVVTVKVCAVIAGTPTASAYNVRVIP
jgi:hypothetical protein